MIFLVFFSYFIFTLWTLSHQLHVRFWEVGSFCFLVLVTWISPVWCFLPVWLVIGFMVALLHEKRLRAKLAGFVYRRAVKSVPRLSQTEEEALSVGDTWIEASLFRGEPDWKTLSEITTSLSEEEVAFLQHEVEALCVQLNEWEISQTRDLPESVWHFMKEKGFFGLVIAKEYGGKGFSARAHSDVVMKLASRSGVAAVTCMVPNSLGPGELITYYGTDAQKKLYLPKLAKGEEIPCFALTEPLAGSDATALQSEAIVCQKKIAGETILGLLIPELEKRWITLAPVATLIGLAVNLKDPEQLLKGEGQEGITCLLISRDTPHLEIGNRHLPTGLPFMNGTIRGKNIFVPITAIIGGQKNAGHGWHMLVECLSIGRSISLPALSAALSSVGALSSGAFSRVRRQFKTEIANFEGVCEKLARMSGLDYLIQATRLLTVAAVDAQQKPSVASAMTKYFNTEHARLVVNDAMDVHAGRMVVMGPCNYLIPAYLSLPIAITVEGANILSRNLLIFGQGSMACHPFVRDEFYAVLKEDSVQFEKIFWLHSAYFLKNMARAFLSAWGRGWFAKVPHHPMRWACRRIVRLSRAFAFISDLALLLLGKTLKRKERLSARLADALSFLYMAMAVLRFAEINHWEKSHCIYAKWALTYCFYEVECALLNFCRAFPSRVVGRFIQLIVFPLGQRLHYPSDTLDQTLAHTMSHNNAYRDAMKHALYISKDETVGFGAMEQTFQSVLSLEENEKLKPFLKLHFSEELEKILADELKNKKLSQAECTQVFETLKARFDAILVDEFTPEAMKKRILKPMKK